MMTINNVARYAENYEYIVYVFADNKAWFYGAWNDMDGAVEQAIDCGGFITNKNKCNLVFNPC